MLMSFPTPGSMGPRLVAGVLSVCCENLHKCSTTSEDNNSSSWILPSLFLYVHSFLGRVKVLMMFPKQISGHSIEAPRRCCKSIGRYGWPSHA